MSSKAATKQPSPVFIDMTEYAATRASCIHQNSGQHLIILSHVIIVISNTTFVITYKKNIYYELKVVSKCFFLVHGYIIVTLQDPNGIHNSHPGSFVP